MLIAAAIFLCLFACISMVDGLYFHLLKYKLYERPQSLQEHITHSIRAVLFAPIVYILFAANHAGWLLWLGVMIVLLDLAIETWDVIIERKSRADLGGLSTAEYFVHINATTFRVAAITLALASKPIAAWNVSGPLQLAEPYPKFVVLLAWFLIACAILGAIQHFWFLLPRYRKSTTNQSTIA